MPNHITNRLILHSEDGSVQRFFEACIKQVDETDIEGKPTGETFTHFDFNTLIPMPPEIQTTESSTDSDIGLLVLTLERIIESGNIFYTPQNDSIALLFLKVNFPGMFREQDFQTFRTAAAWLKRERPQAMEKGATALACLIQHGHKDWYSWANANWNTKWNSYAFQTVKQAENEGEITFQTAWSVPEPIIHKLCEQFPSLKVTVRSWDEGWNFAYRCSNEEGGWKDHTWQPKNDNASDLAFYEQVYGRPYECDEEDDDAE